MLALVADSLVHEPASGPARIGKAAFAHFLQHLHDCYFESAENLIVAAAGDSAATAEFGLRRLDLATYADRLVGMPVTIQFGACYRFETRGTLITRIVMEHVLIGARPSHRAPRRMAGSWLHWLWNWGARGT